MSLDQYRFVPGPHSGIGAKTFMTIQCPDGSTLEVEPNEKFMLDHDPEHPEIVKTAKSTAPAAPEEVNKPAPDSESSD